MLKTTQVYSGGIHTWSPIFERGQAAYVRTFAVNTRAHKNSLKYGPTLTLLLTQKAHMASPQTIWIFSLSLGEGVTQISLLTHLS